jgi:hypothetical protein
VKSLMGYLIVGLLAYDFGGPFATSAIVHQAINIARGTSQVGSNVSPFYPPTTIVTNRLLAFLDTKLSSQTGAVNFQHHQTQVA